MEGIIYAQSKQSRNFSQFVSVSFHTSPGSRDFLIDSFYFLSVLYFLSDIFGLT